MPSAGWWCLSACVLVQVNICNIHDSGLFSWLVCGYSTCQSCQFSASAFGVRVLGLSCAQREGEKGRKVREKQRERERERVKMGSMPTIGATWTYLSCLLLFGRAILHIIWGFFLSVHVCVHILEYKNLMLCACVCMYVGEFPRDTNGIHLYTCTSDLICVVVLGGRLNL